MYKKVALGMFVLMIMAQVAALDNQTYLYCGGDNELFVKCNIGDEEISFHGNFPRGLELLKLLLFSPLNITYESSTVGLLAGSSGPDADTFWYILNDGTNVTFNPNTSLTNLGFNANHNITVYVNDSAGNTDSITRFFRVGELPNDKWLYFYGITLGLALLLFILGYSQENYFITMLSGFLIMAFGITFLNQGYPGLDSQMMQLSIIVISIGFSSYVMLRSGLGIIQEGI